MQSDHRSRAADIRLPEVEVSKSHARILRNTVFFRSTYCLMDIGSKNGTFLNDDRLAPITNDQNQQQADVVRFFFFLSETTPLIPRNPAVSAPRGPHQDWFNDVDL
jgi:pSer/pThr/pTyr-binding forkhead associated (FHA) protein